MNGHCVEIWNNCLKLISENISPQSYKTWFEPIKPLAFEDDMLTIQVPSQFFHEYLEEHYHETLNSRLLAEAFNYDNSYFCRLFKKIFGIWTFS